MKPIRSAAALLLALSLAPVAAPAAHADSNYDAPVTTAAAVQVNPIPGLRSDFIKGADVSMLAQIEASGGHFNDHGETDLLQIMKNHGVNWVRLRIWNNPKNPETGEWLGGGNNDEARTIDLARRAKAKGFKVLLDFHYSDFWADPGKQNKPAAWVNLSGAALEKAVYDYTAKVVQDLKAANAAPDMVQIGNETNGGMIWPDGKTWQQTPEEKIGDYDGWVALLKKGVQAVRDNDLNKDNPASKIKVMLHLADGGDNKLYRRVFKQLTDRNVDFDVMGFSYYPYWHGSLASLEANMNDMAALYHKEVVVAETAYGFTLDNGDKTGNNFTESEENTGGYRATVQGQAQEVRDVMEAVSKVKDENGNAKGLGIFYWEPDWIPVEGAGWKTGEGNGWENQAMFDFKGNALPSLDVFNLVSGSGPTLIATPTKINDVALKVSVGSEVTLPAAVKVNFSDDSIRSIPVVWEAFDPQDVTHPGTIVVNGTLQGMSQKAKATVTVRGMTNYVTNPGFETGNFNGWTITDSSGALAAEKSTAPSGNAHAGDYSMHYYKDQPFQFTATQTFTGLKNGTYTLSAWTQGGGGENKLQLVASNGKVAKAVDIHNTAWHEWKHPTIPNIVVTNGTLNITVNAEGNKGNWGNIDDFELVTDNSAETLQAPGSVTEGSAFTASIGVGGLPDIVYAQDVTVQYDASLFDFVKAEGAQAGTVVLDTYTGVPGSVRLLVSHDKGFSTNSGFAKITFKAKDGKAGNSGSIAVKQAQWGFAPQGSVVQPLSLASAQISIGSADSSSVSVPTPTKETDKPQVSVGKDGEAQMKQQPKLEDGKAVASLDVDTFNQMMAKTSLNGSEKRIVLEIPAVEGTDKYVQKLPTQALTSDKRDTRIDIVTPVGKLSVSGNMLSSMTGIAGDQVSINISPADRSTIPDSLKQRIGDKPVVDFSIEAGGKQVAWSNPDAPITVSVPYKPSGDEAQNPEHIVIWYLSPNGEAVPVPNAAYDPATGTVNFTITHFSTYAVAYVQVTFPDVDGLDWAKQAVGVLASKGVITGTGGDRFSPERSVTRADFLVMLTKALGLSAKVEANFSDVQSSDYYYDAVGAAYKLGIADGIGDNHFNPQGNVSRQDMMVMAYRALQAAGKLSANAAVDKTELGGFADGADVADYAKASVATLVKARIVNGKGSAIAPHDTTTRAEAAVIVYRAVKP